MSVFFHGQTANLQSLLCEDSHGGNDVEQRQEQAPMSVLTGHLASTVTICANKTFAKVQAPLPPKDISAVPPFGVVTIPKTGSHLLIKCLELLQDRLHLWARYHLKPGALDSFQVNPDLNPLNESLNTIVDEKHYVIEHAQLTGLLQGYMNEHPDYPVLVGVRDLRDVIVSQAHYTWNNLEKTLGPTTLEQKITHLMNLENRTNSDEVPIIHLHAGTIFRLLDKKNVLVVRFEDLVGSKGEGSDEKQREVIKRIAKHIGAAPSEERISKIQSILFGNDTVIPSMEDYNTFRQGKKGNWKDVLTPKQIEYFNQHYGKYQLALGYTILKS